LSVSEPEIPKPDESVVETPSPNFLGDLEAQSKALREELDTARQRLAVVEKQIADSAADRTDDEPLRQKLKQTEEKLAEVTRDRDSLKQQVETLTADRQQVEAQLSDLQKRLDEVEQNSAPAIDLSDKAGEVMNFFRTLLPKDTKLPKNTMTKLREILEATED
jgi:chromosome segregation ATPase